MSTPNFHGRSALHISCEKDRGGSCCRALLGYVKEGDPVLSDADEYGQTCLHLAIANDNLECVKMLLHKLAPIASTTNWAQNALHLACIFGRDDIVRAVLLRADHKIIDLADNRGRTPLMLAATFGNEQAVTDLLQKAIARLFVAVCHVVF